MYSEQALCNYYIYVGPSFPAPDLPTEMFYIIPDNGSLSDESDSMRDDIVEAHCYFVDIGRTDREQIRSRINNNDCRPFRPRRPLSTAYRTKETAV